MDREDKFGFIYVKDVYLALDKYESQNFSWENYFPELLSTMMEIINKQKTKSL